MTIWDLLRIARSHPILLVLVALVVATGVAAAARPVHVWNGTVRVVLLAPPSNPRNPYGSTSRSLVAMAGLVARDVEGFDSPPQTVDSYLTLPSQGVASGFQVRQHNRGGQWVSFYEDPSVDVQSTGPTHAAAKSAMQAGVDAVLSSLDDLQNSQSVPSDWRIRTQLTPQNPVYTMQSGSRVRAVGAAAALGVMGALGALGIAEAVSRRRRGTRPENRSRDDGTHQEHSGLEPADRPGAGVGTT